MKLYAPKYYKDFVCIADRCRHSCCVGWEIDIDDAALEKYSSLEGGYGNEIRESIDSEDTPHFALAEGDRCPHLDGCGLCRIITNLGEGYLCDICREHPRFYNDTARGREVGLGLSCEEACRIILSSDEYAEMIEIDDICEDCKLPEFDSTEYRNNIYSILSDSALSYPEKLCKIYAEYDISPEIRSDGEWRELLSSLEYLEEDHRELFAKYSSEITLSPELEAQHERALAYFIYRHCSPACDEDDFRAALGFSLFCERLLASIADENNITDAARILSEEIEYSEENTEAVRLEFAF